MRRVFNCDECHVEESIPNSPDSVQSPRAGAGLRFAVSALSKTMDVGRDQLIHRKRSLFPEKTEWRVESEEWRVELMALDI